jgi:hypothetical protein
VRGLYERDRKGGGSLTTNDLRGVSGSYLCPLRERTIPVFDQGSIDGADASRQLFQL